MRALPDLADTQMKKKKQPQAQFQSLDTMGR